jgi:hypothetical protein
LTSTISAWRPVRSKWRAAIFGYFVAIRMTPEPAQRLLARVVARPRWRAPSGSARSRGRAARRRRARTAP